jgi:uncharacterized protein
MTVELRPLGVQCNLQCQYCYQNNERDAGNLRRPYDLERMKSAIREEGGPFSLFGGEPLMVPLADLEDLWAWGLAQYGSNGVQTNGTLITDEHIRLFRTYRVQVGISLDGPGDLNDARWSGDLARTRAATQRSEEAIERLCRAGLPPSLILTLHRSNATPDRLPSLLAWVRRLVGAGVVNIRIHLLEAESVEVRDKYALSSSENLEALMAFAELERELPSARFDVFEDMRRMLMGDDRSTTCVWNACDPLTTPAVRGVEGDGQRSNCGRTNKDGVGVVKAERAGYERYLALYHTPQEHGGCGGCRFFLMCKGQCPGTAIDGDFRNRSEHCAVWMGLYEHLEAELLAAGRSPLSTSPGRVELERRVLERWERGQPAPLADLVTPSVSAPAAIRAQVSLAVAELEAALAPP